MLGRNDEGDSCEEENNNLCGCFSCHYTRVIIC